MKTNGLNNPAPDEMASRANMGDYAPTGIVVPPGKTMREALELLLIRSPLAGRLPKNGD